MSKGAGWVQRGVVAYLSDTDLSANDGWILLWDLTCALFDTGRTSNPTRAELESVRRALRKLQAREQVDLSYLNAPSYGNSRRRQLWARAHQFER